MKMKQHFMHGCNERDEAQASIIHLEKRSRIMKTEKLNGVKSGKDLIIFQNNFGERAQENGGK